MLHAISEAAADDGDVITLLQRWWQRWRNPISRRGERTPATGGKNHEAKSRAKRQLHVKGS